MSIEQLKRLQKRLPEALTSHQRQLVVSVGSKGRPPNRHALPLLRPIMEADIITNPSVGQVIDALNDFIDNADEPLREKHVRRLLARDGYVSARKIVPIDRALRKYCESKKRTVNGSLTVAYNAQVDMGPARAFAQYIGQEPDVVRTVSEQCGLMTNTVKHVMFKGELVPHVLAQQIQAVVSTHLQLAVGVNPGVDEAGKPSLRDTSARHDVDNWLIRHYGWSV